MPERDELVRKAAEALRQHQTEGPFGGSATGSTAPCTCGEQNFINSVRDMAAARGRAHQARAVLDAVANDIRAEALREAAAAVAREPLIVNDLPRHRSHREFYGAWLHNRADRIAGSQP